jgi:hypothetical protein
LRNAFKTSQRMKETIEEILKKLYKIKTSSIISYKSQHTKVQARIRNFAIWQYRLSREHDRVAMKDNTITR